MVLAEGVVEQPCVLRVMRDCFQGRLEEDSNLGDISVYRKYIINLNRQLKGDWESWLLYELAHALPLWTRHPERGADLCRTTTCRSLGIVISLEGARCGPGGQA